MQAFSISQPGLPYSGRLSVAGVLCQVNTNSEAFAELVMAASDECGASEGTALPINVLVDEDMECPAGTPHFRGLHHVVIASFGATNVFVYDLLRCNVNARVSAPIARDVDFWRQKMLPITLGVMGAAVGTMPMHSACVASGREGLLIAGPSGAGKSTLSVALSQAGFEYISDDWTYLSCTDDRLAAHGTSAPVKLLPDAVRHFAALSRHALQTSMNGELAYQVDASQTFGARQARACEPRWLLFLERRAEPGSEFTCLPAIQTRAWLEASVERLPVQLAAAERNRAEIIARVAQLPCWKFRYGGPPQFAAEQLADFVAGRKQAACA